MFFLLKYLAVFDPRMFFRWFLCIWMYGVYMYGVCTFMCIVTVDHVHTWEGQRSSPDILPIALLFLKRSFPIAKFASCKTQQLFQHLTSLITEICADMSSQHWNMQLSFPLTFACYVVWDANTVIHLMRQELLPTEHIPVSWS